MSRILLCSTLIAALSGGPAALTGVATRADYLIPTSHPAPTGPVAPISPDGMGEKTRSRFSWPLPGSPIVVRPFQPPTMRYGPGHRGVDLTAAEGTPVLAAGAGTVVFAGTVAGRGVVSVDHPGGLRTTYEPVLPIVTAGDPVVRGAQIGTVQLGHPGCPVTACLHWGAFRGPGHDKEYLNPLRLLATARVRLLPIDGQPDLQ